jgi:transposase
MLQEEEKEEEKEEEEGQVLEHLGIVMATIKKIGLIEAIDKRLPISQEKGAKVTMGERVAAMILNALGFTDDRLYLFPEFLENKPVERLFRPGLSAEDFNDDALGRCLDALYAYGLTKLFCEISFEIGIRYNLLGKTARLDTTSLTVYGNYDQEEGDSLESNGLEKEGEEKAPFQVTHGYSKDGRGDLKQMILNLATTGKANLPIWFSAHSGNASDKIVIQQAAERIKEFSQALEEGPEFIFVGDSAMYEKCVERASDLKWLSRVPHVSNQAKQVLAYKQEELGLKKLDKGYQVSQSIVIKYKGVEQRWVVVCSEQMYKRSEETLNKKLAKESANISKKLWHISNQEFSCKQDAHKAIKPLERSLKYHSIEYSVEGVEKYSKAGRPKAGEEKEVIGYKLKGKVEVEQEKIEKAKQELGKFILATNELDVSQLSEESMLKEYKEQQHTERGFRFMKSNTFEVTSVFLKKPSRIQALMMLMTMFLMVHNLAEYILHQELKERKASIKNQSKKEVSTPSIAYVFRKFQGIQVVRVNFDGQIKERMLNLQKKKKELRLIISCFGPIAEKIYGIAA